MKNLSIHITDQCNSSCEFCVVDSHQGNPEQVNKNTILKFIQDNKNNGYEMVNIHGGEPTLIPELIEILDNIRENGYKSVSIQTNARKLADLKYATELCSKGIELFVISLHGKDAEIQDSISQVENSFNEAIEGIKNIKSLGKKIRTNTVVCNKNKDQIKEIVEFIISLGVDHVNISNMHPVGKAFKNFKKTVPKISEFIDEVKAAVDLAVSKNCIVTLEGFPFCVLGEYSKYVINWDEQEFKLLYHDRVLQNYDDFMKNETKKKGKMCGSCNEADKCGGVYKEYLMFNGWDEINKAKNLCIGD